VPSRSINRQCAAGCSLFQADQILKDVNSFDKSLAEKIAFIEGPDKKDKFAFYAVLDAFIGKKN